MGQLHNDALSFVSEHEGSFEVVQITLADIVGMDC